MPNHRTPTEILELKGSFKHNPHRARPVGPKSDQPIGRPPQYFSADETAVWKELVANSPANVLTVTDRPILEIVTRLLTKFRHSSDLLPAPLLSQLASNLARLGWTPADRSRVTAAQGDKKPDFDFLQ